MAQIDQFLEEILKRRGSDLHFIAGDPPRIRMNGELSPLRGEPLTAEFAKPAELFPEIYQDWGDSEAYSLQLGRGECAA